MCVVAHQPGGPVPKHSWHCGVHNRDRHSQRYVPERGLPEGLSRRGEDREARMCRFTADDWTVREW
jgi:hypothetical protein